MSIKTIAEEARAKVDEMGGGEQFIGEKGELAASCGAKTKNQIFDWMIDLGDALEEQNLVLFPWPGKPERLYVRPKED